MDPITIMKRFAPGVEAHLVSPGRGFKLSIDPLPHRRYKDAITERIDLLQLKVLRFVAVAAGRPGNPPAHSPAP